MSEESSLVEEYDVLILGTSVKNTILASGLAIQGIKVLCWDRFPNYGTNLTTFNLSQMLLFLNRDNNLHIKDFKFEFYNLSFEYINELVQLDIENQQQPQEVIDLFSCLDLTDPINYENNLLSFFKIQLGLRDLNLEYLKLLVQTILDKFLIEFLKIKNKDLVNLLLFKLVQVVKFWLIKDNQFQLELNPQLNLSSDKLVDLLFKSQTYKYLSFKLVNFSQAYSNDEFIKVPSSKETIFSTQQLNLITKHKLMKAIKYIVMTQIAHDQTDTEQYEDKTEAVTEDESLNLSIGQLLSEKFKLEKREIDSLLYTTFLLPSSSYHLKVKDILPRFQTILQSVGKYGPHPLLYTQYGNGAELSQAFARLAAIYQATFLTNQPFNLTELNGNDQTDYRYEVDNLDGLKFKVKKVVADLTHLQPPLNTAVKVSDYVLRRTLVIKGFLTEESKDLDVSLTSFPPTLTTGVDNPIYALTVTYNAMATPNPCVVVYLWCQISKGNYNEQVHMETVNRMDEAQLNYLNKINRGLENNDSPLPQVLIKMEYTYQLHQPTALNDRVGVDGTITWDTQFDPISDFQLGLQQTEEIFKRLVKEINGNQMDQEPAYMFGKLEQDVQKIEEDL